MKFFSFLHSVRTWLIKPHQFHKNIFSVVALLIQSLSNRIVKSLSFGSAPTSSFMTYYLFAYSFYTYKTRKSPVGLLALRGRKKVKKCFLCPSLRNYILFRSRILPGNPLKRKLLHRMLLRSRFLQQPLYYPILLGTGPVFCPA